MKLESLYIDGYKGLRELSIDFAGQTSPAVVNFLIGPNGSGKSSVLEALGLIFTRVMQGETPGFDFELRYRMADGTGVFIKPREREGRKRSGFGKRLLIRTEKSGEDREYDAVPNDCLPDRIVSYCSGANNSMEEILISSPRDSLASDLYDLSLEDEDEADYERIRSVLDYYEQLDINPRVLYLDADTSKLVLPVLFAVLPLDIQSRDKKEMKRYGSLREELLGRLGVKVVPTAFSFRVNEERLEQAGDMPQTNIPRQMLRESVYAALRLAWCVSGGCDK